MNIELTEEDLQIVLLALDEYSMARMCNSFLVEKSENLKVKLNQYDSNLINKRLKNEY